MDKLIWIVRITETHEDLDGCDQIHVVKRGSLAYSTPHEAFKYLSEELKRFGKDACFIPAYSSENMDAVSYVNVIRPNVTYSYYIESIPIHESED